MSEAAMYQAIRKYWKECRNAAQRRYEQYRWEHENAEKHPSCRKAVASMTNRSWEQVHIPIARKEALWKDMYKERAKISQYQELLNSFKLEKE